MKRPQGKLEEAIKLLKIACKGDRNAEAYVIDHLKILKGAHNFCDSSLNLDNLIERYEDDDEDVGGDDLIGDF